MSFHKMETEKNWVSGQTCLETGEVHKAEDGPGKSDKQSDSEDEEDNPRVVEDEREVKRRKLEKKRALKARFDAGKMNLKIVVVQFNW